MKSIKFFILFIVLFVSCKGNENEQSSDFKTLESKQSNLSKDAYGLELYSCDSITEKRYPDGRLVFQIGHSNGVLDLYYDRIKFLYDDSENLIEKQFYKKNKLVERYIWTYDLNGRRTSFSSIGGGKRVFVYNDSEFEIVESSTKNKVKIITKLDSISRKIRVSELYDEIIKTDSIFTYREDSYVVEIKTNLSNGKLISNETLWYNSIGKIYRKIIDNNDENGQSNIIYDELGNELENTGNGFGLYATYNSKGDVVEQCDKPCANVCNCITKYRFKINYDAQGRKDNVIKLDKLNNIIYEINWSYDDNGMLKTITQEEQNKGFDKDLGFIHVYNSKYELIEEINFKKGNPISRKVLNYNKDGEQILDKRYVESKS